MRPAPSALFESPIETKRRLRGERPASASTAVLDFAQSRLPGPADYNLSSWRSVSSPSFSFGGQGIRSRKTIARRANESPGPASLGFLSTKVLSKGLSF